MEIVLGVAALLALAAVAYGAGTGRYVPRWPAPVRRRVLVAGQRATRPGAAVLVAIGVVAGVGGRPLAAVALAVPGLAIAALLEVSPLALERRRRGVSVRDALVVAGVAGAAAVLVAGGLAVAH